jgi:hypothetical protein
VLHEAHDGAPALPYIPCCRETVKYFTNEQLEEDKYSEAIDGYQVRAI